MGKAQKDNLTNTPKWKLWTYFLPLLNKIAQFTENLKAYCIPTDQQFADDERRKMIIEEAKDEYILKLDSQESIQYFIDEDKSSSDDLTNFKSTIAIPASQQVSSPKEPSPERIIIEDALELTTLKTKAPTAEGISDSINKTVTPFNSPNNDDDDEDFIDIKASSSSLFFDDADLIDVESSNDAEETNLTPKL